MSLLNLINDRLSDTNCCSPNFNNVRGLLDDEQLSDVTVTVSLHGKPPKIFKLHSVVLAGKTGRVCLATGPKLHVCVVLYFRLQCCVS